MDILQTLADISIRRACGFAALGIGTVMLALSYDLELAFRSGAILTSIACIVIWLLAWRSPRRDVRETELWSMLASERLYLTRGPEAPRIRALAGRILHERLVWHGQRVAFAAMALWICTGIAVAARLVLGD
ncbi:hypothetical protein [Neoroseomonas lacus]|uniref:Uncharacterized protein n=1 Tax=Neoroseomonas lacus TaxID=287609 RepID=A0A917NMC8_9PROT|nr:hypothetical protein [Neoroseomonas lacus]GGJ11600.1 hypothetical protein GCM10011320_18350 [Neoroseomonas lacus]